MNPYMTPFGQTADFIWRDFLGDYNSRRRHKFKNLNRQILFIFDGLSNKKRILKIGSVEAELFFHVYIYISGEKFENLNHQILFIFDGLSNKKRILKIRSVEAELFWYHQSIYL